MTPRTGIPDAVVRGYVRWVWTETLLVARMVALGREARALASDRALGSDSIAAYRAAIDQLAAELRRRCATTDELAEEFYVRHAELERLADDACCAAPWAGLSPVVVLNAAVFEVVLALVGAAAPGRPSDN
jgi:hypothetical protein